MFKIKILGCGSSHGVPVIGCKCQVCLSRTKYNKRRRSSIIIEKNNVRLLIDFGHDIKDQLVDADIDSLKYAILTHDHADHVSGIDNLRIFKFLQDKPVKIFAESTAAKVVRDRYAYLFNKNELEIVEADFYEVLDIEGLKIQLFRQTHADVDSLGIRIDNFVYSSDVKAFPDLSKKYLKGIDVWIVDCLGYKSNYAHAGLEQVLQWQQEFLPRKIYLTNMRDEIDYHKIIRILPENIRPLYDGMIIEIE